MIVYNKEARERLKAGVDALANAVKVTLGPNGTNVVIRTEAGPYITKDGVTVAKHVFLEDMIEDMGAQMIKEVSLLTNKEVGDGTTTSTVLAQAILEEGFKSDKEPNEIKKELDIDLKIILETLDTMSTSLEEKDVYKIANVSTNGDKILSDIITECYNKVGNSVMFETSSTNDTYYEITEGLKFDNTSYISPYFINKGDGIAEFTDAQVLLLSGKFDNVKSILPVLQQATKPVVIFCDDMDNNCIMTLTRNNKEGSKKSIALRSPGFGYGRISALKDIAAFTGARLYSNTSQLNGEIQFGEIDSVYVEKYTTYIKGGKGSKEDIDERLRDLEFSKKDDSSIMDKIDQRISQFKDGMATIYVGAASELEMKEKRDRLEDGINAVRAAKKEGYIQGGGIALYTIGSSLESILGKAIQYPYELLGSPKIDNDIIDPVLVTKTALKNAVSVAGTILTTNTVIGYE